MRLVTLVTVLLIGCIQGQICNFSSWKKYADSRCTRSAVKQTTAEANIHKTIQSAVKSGKCVYQQGTRGLKFKASCRDKDTIYVKFYNFNDEDPGCTRAYTSSQEIVPGLRLPPLTLDNGKCEAFGPQVWIRPTIKSTSKTTSKKKVPKCTFKSWKKYLDSSCSRSTTKKSAEANVHKTIQKAIESGKCTYQSGSSGLKFKASCKDGDTIYLKFYNFNNEDPSCTRAYTSSQEVTRGLRLPPLTIDNGRCEAFGPGVWIRPTIKSNTVNLDKALAQYNKAVDDAASMAVGILVAIIIGSICGCIICIACCVFLIRAASGGNRTVVIAEK